MVRGVGKRKFYFGNKANHKVLFVHHGTDGFGSWYRSGNERRSRAACRLLPSFVVGTRPGMIGRNKGWIVGVNAEWAGPGQDQMMPHSRKDLVGLSLVVVDALSIAPAVRGEVERHGEVLLTIGSRAGGPRSAVGIHRPREVSDGRIVGIGDPHVGLGPVPDGVE